MNRIPIFLRHSAIILAAALFLTAPHFIYGYPTGHSAAYNIHWQHFFSQQLLSGEFYPRWLTDYPTGLGAPVFYFYAPLPFYLASFIGTTVCFSCSVEQTLSVTHIALFTFSGIAFYFWCSHFARRSTCLIASLFYVLLPYHYLDSEIRNALGESMAYLWAPLIFSALYRLTTKGGLSARLIVFTAIAYAGLILTHLPSAVLITPFMLIFVGAFSTRTTAIQKILQLAATGALGVALSGAYIIPAVLMRDMLPPDVWISKGKYMAENSLLFSSGLPKFGLLIYADLAIASLISILAVAVVIGFRRWCEAPPVPFASNRRRILVAALFSVAVSWLLMSEASRWIWINIDIFRQVQFPWRLGIQVDFWAATILALALSGIAGAPSLRKKRLAGYCLGLIGMTVILVPIAADVAHMMRFRYIIMQSDWSDALPATFPIAPEYQPKWAVDSVAYKETMSEPYPYERFQTHVTTLPEIAIERPILGNERIAMNRIGPTTFEIAATLRAPAQLTVRQAYFPTWTLSNMETGQNIPIQPSAATGLITTALPEGQHHLRLSIEQTWLEIVGRNVSTMAAFLCLLVLLTPMVRSLRFTNIKNSEVTAKIRKMSKTLFS